MFCLFFSFIIVIRSGISSAIAGELDPRLPEAAARLDGLFIPICIFENDVLLVAPPSVSPPLLLAVVVEALVLVLLVKDFLIDPGPSNLRLRPSVVTSRGFWGARDGLLIRLMPFLTGLVVPLPLDVASTRADARPFPLPAL
jgi:hypothetical protein